MATEAATPKILILGAGISGLSSAERLFLNGYNNVQILEATNRIGGRIRTEKFGDGWVEIGAQWVHGQEDCANFHYASEHNLLVADPSRVIDFQNISYRTDDSGMVDSERAEKFDVVMSAKLNDISEDNAEKFGNVTIETYLNDKFRAIENESKTPQELAENKGLLKLFKHLQKSIEGCDSLEELTPKSFIQYYECEGNSLINFKNGYTSLVDTVASNVPKSAIQLNKPVSKISLRQHQAGNEKAVSVTCEDGSRYDADHVIVTFPLGFLKENAERIFDPPLSTEKMDAIKKIGFGTVDKIFLEFEHSFWPEDCGGYSLVWKTDDSEPWAHNIFGMFTVPFARNVLLGWITGAPAREMEQKTDEEVKNECVKILRRFTGKSDLPAVKSLTRSTWHSQKYTKGSYSYLNAKILDNAVIAEPVYISRDLQRFPAIMFAGEATHPHYYSTVHGAMETGRREADRIISYHRGKQAPSNPSSKL